MYLQFVLLFRVYLFFFYICFWEINKLFCAFQPQTWFVFFIFFFSWTILIVELKGQNQNFEQFVLDTGQLKSLCHTIRIYFKSDPSLE